MSARFVLDAGVSGLLFCVDESLKAVCAFGQRCATEPARKKTKFDGRLGVQSYLSSLPEKFRRAMDFRWEAFVHGTIERGLLKDFSLRMIGPERDVNF